MQNGAWHAIRNDLHNYSASFPRNGCGESGNTSVYGHWEHLASSRIGRLMSGRCLTDASSGDMTPMTAVGRFEDDDGVM